MGLDGVGVHIVSDQPESIGELLAAVSNVLRDNGHLAPAEELEHLGAR
jgi:hypothetical protein